ncbi:MacB family efflux pump subunit [Rhodoferax sp. U11-2br]|uniref:MacB family efflux pump subunit n=1 Tax=Rhodoferax sp. U11-2br TaxID=2838878 RepID=UPI001BEB4148|nr:MacB family efflux pump subunit [Rhodoferax sp. U11-2br]MBT3068744.1 MacB family efflux pump subunit [Rhodoferax sp. U11-2br]
MSAGAPLISLRGIRRSYGGTGGVPAVEVLHGVSLDIHAGEFVAIVGASGSGKSTLMHLLGCLDQPSAGTYHFDGQDVSTMDADQLAWLRREAFGFVFQGYHLIASATAQENVEVPAIYAGLPEEERAERAAQLLIRLGLGERLDNRPSQLSGGQQQRVSIARALMNGGRTILADEPTGALDSKSGAEVMALLHTLADAGHTIILITHDRNVASQARRVVEIHDGQIVADSGTQKADLQEKLSSSPNLTGVSSYQKYSESKDQQASVWADLREASRTAWRGMRLNRARTGLTLLGIIIGVASVIVMLAVGAGTEQRVMQQMGALGTTIMYLGSRAPTSGGPVGVLTNDDLADIARLPEVRHVMPIIGDPITVRYGRTDRQVYVFASSKDMPEVHHWKLAQGRYFTDAEDRDLAPLVVLGYKASAHFFPDRPNPLGQFLLVGNSPFEVIGVMAERGADSGVQDYDDMVFIPYHAGRARVYQTQTQPDYTVVNAIEPELAQAAEAAVRKLLLSRHGREDFGISNAAAKLQAEAETRGAMTLMLGLIAAVSLVVGGIGVMNVMLMTVRERTREIGIRMATGARQRDILRQFLIEAVLVTFLGGAVGVAIGLAIGGGLIVSGVPVVFSLSAMAGAFGCAVATGLLFGYMPARKASALDPVVALASE